MAIIHTALYCKTGRDKTMSKTHSLLPGNLQFWGGGRPDTGGNAEEGLSVKVANLMVPKRTQESSSVLFSLGSEDRWLHRLGGGGSPFSPILIQKKI